MQIRNGTLPKDKKDKEKDRKHKDKKDKKCKRHEDRDEVDRRERDHRRSQSRSRSPPGRTYHDSGETKYDDRDRRRSRSPYRRNARDEREERTSHERPNRRSRSPEPTFRRRHSRSPPRRNRREDNKSRRSRSQRPVNKGYSATANERAARLAAMSSNASALTVDRKERLTNLLAEEKLELEAEDQRRAIGKSRFLYKEQKKLGVIEETFRRGRGGGLCHRQGFIHVFQLDCTFDDNRIAGQSRTGYTEAGH